MSQERLAELCDRHRTFVSLLERGRQTASLPTLFRLADALQTRPSTLIKRVEEQLASVQRGDPRT
jgi:transcriptional regulator with XRE-family HTH domain